MYSLSVGNRLRRASIVKVACGAVPTRPFFTDMLVVVEFFMLSSFYLPQLEKYEEKETKFLNLVCD